MRAGVDRAVARVLIGVVHGERLCHLVVAAEAATARYENLELVDFVKVRDDHFVGRHLDQERLRLVLELTIAVPADEIGAPVFFAGAGGFDDAPAFERLFSRCCNHHIDLPSASVALDSGFPYDLAPLVVLGLDVGRKFLR